MSGEGKFSRAGVFIRYVSSLVIANGMRLLKPGFEAVCSERQGQDLSTTIPTAPKKKKI
jgi:hypothetical protein